MCHYYSDTCNLITTMIHVTMSLTKTVYRLISSQTRNHREVLVLVSTARSENMVYDRRKYCNFNTFFRTRINFIDFNSPLQARLSDCFYLWWLLDHLPPVRSVHVSYEVANLRNDALAIIFPSCSMQCRYSINAKTIQIDLFQLSHNFFTNITC